MALKKQLDEKTKDVNDKGKLIPKVLISVVLAFEFCDIKF